MAEKNTQIFQPQREAGDNCLITKASHNFEALPKPIRLMCYNIESLSNKTFFITEYMKSNQIDICILQEIWSNNSIRAVETEINDMGWKIDYVVRSKRGGGLGVIYDKNITDLQFASDSVQYSTFEHQSILLKTRTNHGIDIHNIYKPPSTDKYAFLEELEAFLEQTVVADIGGQILLGDFNQTWDNNERLIDVAMNYNFKPEVTKPTNIFGNITDQIFTKNIMLSDVEVSDRISTSKHFAISCSIKISLTATQMLNEPNFSRNYKDLNVQLFKSKLADLLYSTDSKIYCNSPNEIIKGYSSAINQILNDLIPLKLNTKPMIRRRYWNINTDLIKLRRQKRKLERNKRKDPNLAPDYNKFLKHYTSELWKNRQKFYLDSLKSNQIDIKGRFRIINHLIGNHHIVKLPKCESYDLLANQFHDWFTKRADTIQKKIGRTQNDKGPNEFVIA